MDSRTQRAIEHAQKYLADRQEAYAAWNAAWDSDRDASREAQLERCQGKIDSLNEHGPVELHNLLWAMGVLDKPMAY